MIIRFLLSAVVAGLCVLVPATASADKVVVDDQIGDATTHDLASVVAHNRDHRVRVKIRAADATAYGYQVFVDRPTGRSWERVLLWSADEPRWVDVRDRKQFRSGQGVQCGIRSAKQQDSDLTLSIPARCFGTHVWLRFRTVALDESGAVTDRTPWSRFAEQG